MDRLKYLIGIFNFLLAGHNQSYYTFLIVIIIAWYERADCYLSLFLFLSLSRLGFTEILLYLQLKLHF